MANTPPQADAPALPQSEVIANLRVAHGRLDVLEGLLDRLAPGTTFDSPDFRDTVVSMTSALNARLDNINSNVEWLGTLVAPVTN